MTLKFECDNMSRKNNKSLNKQFFATKLHRETATGKVTISKPTSHKKRDSGRMNTKKMICDKETTDIMTTYEVTTENDYR